MSIYEKFCIMQRNTQVFLSHTKIFCVTAQHLLDLSLLNSMFIKLKKREGLNNKSVLQNFLLYKGCLNQYS